MNTILLLAKCKIVMISVHLIRNIFCLMLLACLLNSLTHGFWVICLCGLGLRYIDSLLAVLVKDSKEECRV